VLRTLTPEILSHHLQVTPENPLAGLEGRTSLLSSLGAALSQSPQYFEDGRPGGMLAYLESHMDADSIPITALWEVVITGLAPIWPADANSGGRASLSGISLGDVWKCQALAAAETEGGVESSEGINGRLAGLVPFHKLSQWLTYSLVEPLAVLMGWHVKGMEDMTGLPEYRNGTLIPINEYCSDSLVLWNRRTFDRPRGPLTPPQCPGGQILPR